MKMRFSAVLAVALLNLGPQPARAEEMQPGQYASTLVVEMVNGQKNTVQDQDCVTAKEIAAGMTRVGLEREEDCKVENLVKGGGKITYRLTCEEDGKKWSAEVAGTYTASSYRFTIKATSPGPGPKQIDVTGKRLGACK